MVAPGYEGPYWESTMALNLAVPRFLTYEAPRLALLPPVTPPITRIRDGLNKTPPTGGKL